MIDLELWLAFLLATTVFLLLPGPAVLVVVGQALRVGSRRALLTAGGVLLGDLVLMLAATSSLGALLLISAEVFTAVKLAGAAYLVFLGVQAWRAAGRADPEPGGRRRRGLFGHGLLVNLMNPKTILFFAAFFPQFVDPGLPAVPQLALLGTTFLLLAALSLLAYALLAGRLRLWLTGPRQRRLRQRLTGGCLVGAGLVLAASD